MGGLLASLSHIFSHPTGNIRTFGRARYRSSLIHHPLRRFTNVRMSARPTQDGGLVGINAGLMSTVRLPGRPRVFRYWIVDIHLWDQIKTDPGLVVRRSTTARTSSRPRRGEWGRGFFDTLSRTVNLYSSSCLRSPVIPLRANPPPLAQASP